MRGAALGSVVGTERGPAPTAVADQSARSYNASEMEAGIAQAHSARPASPPGIPATGPLRRGLRRAQLLVSGAVAVFLGLLPHILHHVGPLAGAALFAGVAGSLLFGAIGLVAAIPFLLRLHRRSGNWRVPAATLALFVAMFSLSAFVIGPVISGEGDGDGGAPARSADPSTAGNSDSGHAAHH